jgi:hypothetical protein
MVASMLCIPLPFCFGFSLCFRRLHVISSPAANGALLRLKIRLLEINTVPGGWTPLVPDVVSFIGEHGHAAWPTA